MTANLCRLATPSRPGVVTVRERYGVRYNLSIAAGDPTSGLSQHSKLASSVGGNSGNGGHVETPETA
ncbi:Hypp9135 [Branchiostoma lanceolatum]|uniref:Hypp9135 protein n=1 Tax=Branchiostoma lanceolatum TaxID=7740 RepID=A0A8J9ZBY9_BRALA|nr:Hypp9135 [Branchiostoma lanceolatum]